MRKNNPALLVVFVFTFIAAFDTNEQLGAAEKEVSSEGAERTARRYLQDFLRISEVPGLAVAIASGGKILFEEAVGFSDLENKVPTSRDTRFRMGSVSKMMTIAAAARLHDKGLFDLDAPASKYLPSLPEAYKTVTARQLAGHLAGVRHYKNSDFEHDSKHSASVKESLSIFTGDPLVHEPGAKYLYSTFGYVLLSALMEGATGKDFITILNEEVFQPLKMKNSSVDQIHEITPFRTRYYERSQGKVANARYEDPSYKWAAAGVITTVGDLVRFGTAHLNREYIQPETLEMMFTSQRLKDGTETGVGIGWRIGKDSSGRRIYHHAGNISGGRSVIILYPDQHFVVAFATNSSSQPPFVERTAQLVAERFLTGNEPARSVPDLTGSYSMTGTHQEKPLKATLKLERAGQIYRGGFPEGFPLREAAVKNGLRDELIVADVFMRKDQPVIILISSFGIVDLILTRDSSGYHFLLDAGGPSKMEGRLEKT